MWAKRVELVIPIGYGGQTESKKYLRFFGARMQNMLSDFIATDLES
jgi:hypothetical protein